MDVREEITIRPFEPADREAVYRICYATAFLGDPRRFVSETDADLVAEAVVGYFTRYEPRSCFVAVDRQDRVVGYLVGTTDARRMQRRSACLIYPALVLRILLRGCLFRGPGALFIYNILRSVCKGEFRGPSFERDYPAVFHINLDSHVRGRGIGRRLAGHFLDDLARRGVRGVHVSSLSPEAVTFFEKLGFRVLFSSRRTYTHYRQGKDAQCVILGRAVGPSP